ncbi:Protein CBG11312, partial [Caenorhabditis briggsae]
ITASERPPGIVMAGIGRPSQSGLNGTHLEPLPTSYYHFSNAKRNSNVKDKYEKSLQNLSTARADFAKMKVEMKQLDTNLDDRITLEKTDQARAAMENSRRIYERICRLSFNRTAIPMLHTLYSEGQTAIESQAEMEEELEERKQLNKKRKVVRERKGKELKEKEAELRNLEWQCRILETVCNRFSLLLKVSGELVRESEEKKIPQLITMVDELKKKLDRNPYVLDDELTRHEVKILEKISKHSKVRKVAKKLRKWFRVEVLGDEKKPKKPKDTAKMPSGSPMKSEKSLEASNRESKIHEKMEIKPQIRGISGSEDSHKPNKRPSQCSSQEEPPRPAKIPKSSCHIKKEIIIY